MLTTHVFPEFTSQHGFLRARVSIYFQITNDNVTLKDQKLVLDNI